jgi:hypothetical protein
MPLGRTTPEARLYIYDAATAVNSRWNALAGEITDKFRKFFYQCQLERVNTHSSPNSTDIALDQRVIERNLLCLALLISPDCTRVVGDF